MVYCAGKPIERVVYSLSRTKNSQTFPTGVVNASFNKKKSKSFFPVNYSLLKARAIRLWPEASHRFKSRCHYRESADSCKNSNFFFFHQKIPLGELFSKTIFKSLRESPVWRKIEKFEISVNLAERRVKIIQIKAFSKRSHETTETCFYLNFTGFVTHVLQLLSIHILSRSMLSFYSFYSRTQCNVSNFVDTDNFTVF